MFWYSVFFKFIILTTKPLNQQSFINIRAINSVELNIKIQPLLTKRILPVKMIHLINLVWLKVIKKRTVKLYLCNNMNQMKIKLNGKLSVCGDNQREAFKQYLYNGQFSQYWVKCGCEERSERGWMLNKFVDPLVFCYLTLITSTISDMT